MSFNQTTGTNEPNPSNGLLSIPAELRNAIYEQTLINDIHPITDFDPTRQPTLFAVCKQTANEYRPIFYASDLLAIDEYYPETDSWITIHGHEAKRAVIEDVNIVFSNLVGKSSLASARRSCQWTSYTKKTSRRGIMTVGSGDAVRWWRWSVLE